MVDVNMTVLILWTATIVSVVRATGWEKTQDHVKVKF